MAEESHGFDRAGAKRIVSATKLVENHLGPIQTPNGKQFSRDQFFVKVGTNISDNKWNAVQVEWDGTDDLDIFDDNEVWDTAIPLYIVGGVAGSEGDILLAESIAADDADSGTVWIALKTAGGSAGFAIITSGSGSSYVANIHDDPDGTNPASETGVTVNTFRHSFGNLESGGQGRLAHKIADVWYITPPVIGG